MMLIIIHYWLLRNIERENKNIPSSPIEETNWIQFSPFFLRKFVHSFIYGRFVYMCVHVPCVYNSDLVGQRSMQGLQGLELQAVLHCSVGTET